MSTLVPADCSTAALQRCTGCSHPSVACGSCRKLLITVTRAAANSDHDTIFFCWCWCSSDASTDTIWFLLTSLCQGCQGIFRYTVVNSTQIVLLLLLWRSQRWTFESRPRIHNPYSKFKILWRRLSNNTKLSNNINLCTYRYRATKHVSTLYASSTSNIFSQPNHQRRLSGWVGISNRAGNEPSRSLKFHNHGEGPY